MERGSDTEIDAILSEQAATWFVRLIANDLSLRERREYLAWLKSSSRHVEALLDIYRYHGYIHKAKPSTTGSPHSGSQTNVIPFSLRGATMVRDSADAAPGRGRGILKIAAMVAGIAFTVIAGWAAKAVYLDQRITTSIGKWDRTMLADGSVLRIGPGTKLRWSFDAERRMVVLSCGEAVFEVARDPTRPFIVTTDVGDVRAIGTQFGVSLNASTAVVTVAHGKVAVSQPNNGRIVVDDSTVTATELVADQQIVMSVAGAQPITRVDAMRELQWATGYYEFRGETVSEAIEQFNRRNELQLAMADPAIGAITLPFTTVKLDDPESFAVMLAARPDVQVAYQNARLIRLLPE